MRSFTYELWGCRIFGSTFGATMLLPEIWVVSCLTFLAALEFGKLPLHNRHLQIESDWWVVSCCVISKSQAMIKACAKAGVCTSALSIPLPKMKVCGFAYLQLRTRSEHRHVSASDSILTFLTWVGIEISLWDWVIPGHTWSFSVTKKRCHARLGSRWLRATFAGHTKCILQSWTRNP